MCVCVCLVCRVEGCQLKFCSRSLVDFEAYFVFPSAETIIPELKTTDFRISLSNKLCRGNCYTLFIYGVTKRLDSLQQCSLV